MSGNWNWSLVACADTRSDSVCWKWECGWRFTTGVYSCLFLHGLLFTAGVWSCLLPACAFAYCRCVLWFIPVCAFVYCRCVVFNNRGNGGAELLVSSLVQNPVPARAWRLFLHFEDFEERFSDLLPAVAFLFFFILIDSFLNLVEISWHILIPLFMPGSVHSCSVSWDDNCFPTRCCLCF